MCEFICLFVYLLPRRRLGFAQEISYAAASKAQAFADLVGAGGTADFLMGGRGRDGDCRIWQGRGEGRDCRFSGGRGRRGGGGGGIADLVAGVERGSRGGIADLGRGGGGGLQF